MQTQEERVGSITFTTDSVTRTRGEVIPLVPQLRFAVKFFLSQLIKQTLVLVLVTRQGCPLLGKVGNTAGTVTLVAYKNKETSKSSVRFVFPQQTIKIWLHYLRCSCSAPCSFCDGSCWASCFERRGWLARRPCARSCRSLWRSWDRQDRACCWSSPVTPCQTAEAGSAGGWKQVRRRGTPGAARLCLCTRFSASWSV